VKSLERTRAVVSAVLRVPLDRVEPAAALGEITALDSLSLAEVASALDDEFGVRLPSENLAITLSVQELAELVERAPRR